MKRVIIIVIDSMGIGAMPDCAEYNDIPECNTIVNVANKNNGLYLPNMGKLGLGNLAQIKGVPKTLSPKGQYGIMREISKGKDTTTGHWEMAGLVLEKPFKVYPNGFDKKIIEEFIEKTNCKGILGNYPASGTKIIEDLHTEHEKTKYPIIYTSADSVFQIAVDIDIIPIEELYRFCKIAREILVEEYNVSRVIARPYKIIDGKPTRIGALRRDYSVEPPKPTVLNEVLDNNGLVLGIGKIEDIFVKCGISHAVHTGGNTEGLALTLKAVKNELDLQPLTIKTLKNTPDKALIFTNLVDTDMLYGHRNNYVGYKNALEEIDLKLNDILKSLTDEDLLIITADHGCDPTIPGTDHTREQVPILVYHNKIKPKDLGIITSFDYVAKLTKNWLF